MGYIDLPVSGGGITIYPNLASFPASAPDGAQGVAADTDSIYIYNSSLPGWVAVATPPVGVFISDLTGDVTATGPGSAAATVAFVGGETAADVATSVQDTQAATSAATPSTIVKRDASGNCDVVQLNASNAVLQKTTATTNAVTNVLKLDSQSSGTPAAGIGVGIEMAAETAAGNTEIGIVLQAVTTDVGSGTEDFDLVVSNMKNGAAASETLRVKSSGEVQVPNYILSPQLYPGGAKTAAFNIDWSNGPIQEFTLNVSGGTVSLASSTFSNAVTGGCYMLKLIQGATPTNITGWPAAVLWGAAGIPTLSGSTGDIDIINFVYDGTNYYGTYALGF